MSLYNQVVGRLVKCTLDEDSRFLPLSDLDDTITQDSIRTQLSFYTRLFCPGLPGRVFLQAKKVFAILVLIDEPWAIRDLIDRDHLRDGDLPLSRKGEQGTGDYNVLISTGSCKTFTSFTSWPKKARVEDFLHKQWLVQAPVLDSISKHMVLDPKCPLPVKESNFRDQGGSGRVHQAKLHPAHYQVLEVGVAQAADTAHQAVVAKVSKAGAEPYIAIKEFRAKRDFEKEKEILERIQHLQHKHLINHIATCEKGSYYYAMFPWADGGNLRTFWKREYPRPRPPELILWSLQQMLGLVGALKALHGETIRHGDIKPFNILHFRESTDTNESGEGTLVIADVGVSKFHRQVTSMRHGGTGATGVTVSYEAPEAEFDRREGIPRSRRYDMWSMGCMFLEFTVWLVYDFNAVRSFRRWRTSTDDPTTAPGNFFSRNLKGPVEVHSSVLDAISHLREDPRCQGGNALEDLIQLIEQRLLQIEVTQRAEASELYDRLEKIVQTAQEKPSYLYGQVDPPPATPSFFKRVKSRQNSNSDSVSSATNLGTI